MGPETSTLSERLQKAVTLTLTAGYQLDKEAFDFLQTIAQANDPVKLVEETIGRAEKLHEKPLFISRSLLEGMAEQIFPEKEEGVTSQPSFIAEAKKIFRPYAKGVDAEIKVVEDPTDKMCGTGSVEEYLEYFRDRFRKLQRILRQRMDTKDASSISDALKAFLNSKVKVIGMITDKREHQQKLFFKIEDLEAEATVLVSPRINQETLEKARQLMLDQVICVSAIKGRNDLLIAEEFFWPDVPQRKPKKALRPVYAVLTSDLHVGSKLFMGDALSRFVLWLNGKYGDENLRKIASHIKYVVIAGDLVDGIGIYPNQVKELAIKDVYKQYRAVAKFVEQIPDYIEVLVIPGNHDASRKALPQPALPRDYAEPLYEARKIISLGNPSTVQLHGVELLLYHGRSLDDIIATAPNMSFNAPEKAMKLLLQSRHLAPVYGNRTPIAPEKRDFMVIENPPDIFHAGHIHVLGYETYRGALIINSGAWQGQTEYQRKLRLTPTPSIVPIVNLQTLDIMTVNFATA
jgi:DNA polymerase II small subunit